MGVLTNTWIGQYFSWDEHCQVNYAMLRANLRAGKIVLENPADFPRANFAAIERKVAEIEDFLERNPE